MRMTITRLPGDGIGPEVTRAASEVLDAIGERFGHKIEWVDALIGGAAIDGTGSPLPEETLRACVASDGILLGAVGGPAWADVETSRRPELGLLRLRQGLGLYANLRPARCYPALAPMSPLKTERIEGVDLLIVRELTGGVYFGRRTESIEHATDECAYSVGEIERVARVAFEAAGRRSGRVCSVDKANVLATSRLWRATVERVRDEEFPEIELEHQLVDAMAMHLLTRPADFDVVLTENMFGDILSDEASVLSGSLGLLPSASLGASGPGLFEPCHGSAPDIAGLGVANPIGAILSVAMMLRDGLGLALEAQAIERAVEATIADGTRTRDLGGEATTEDITRRVIEGLDAQSISMPSVSARNA